MLSESVSKALHLTGGEEASEIAHFVGMVDKFFACLNVHNYVHGIHKRKFFQMPYTSSAWYMHVCSMYVHVQECSNYPSHCALRSHFIALQWLEQDFLGYLAAWESSVEERPGYTKTEKGRMLLSPATRLGIRMTCTHNVM